MALAVVAALVLTRSRSVYDSVRRGNLAELEERLAAGADPDETRRVGVRDGPVIVERVLDTPLMAAIRRGHLEVAEALLQGGADPDLGSDEGGYPLIQAMSYRDEPYPYVQLLLMHGARVEGCTYRGVPVWEWASSRADWRTFAVIWQEADRCRRDPSCSQLAFDDALQRGSRYDRHVVAALIENPDLLSALIVTAPLPGAMRLPRMLPIQEVGRFPLPPLHRAVLVRDLVRVEELLAGGAAGDRPTPMGFTPLMAAALVDWPEGVALLGGRGASPTQLDGYGTSAMHLAASRGSDATWAWFVEAVGLPGPEDGLGRSALEVRKHAQERRGR